MKKIKFLLIIISFFVINCGGSSHSTYMHNRSLDQQIADKEREKIINEEQSKQRMQGTVDSKMEEFNKKALEKQPQN